MMEQLHPGRAGLGPPEDWSDFVQVVDTPDLDGDGAPDQVRFGGATGMNGRSFLYVQRGTCGHHVGTVYADVMLGALPTWHRGLRDLGGPSGCPVLCCPKTTVRRWEFNGVRYGLSDERVEQRVCEP